jgi:hypothetical protein
LRKVYAFYSDSLYVKHPHSRCSVLHAVNKHKKSRFRNFLLSALLILAGAFALRPDSLIVEVMQNLYDDFPKEKYECYKNKVIAEIRELNN